MNRWTIVALIVCIVVCHEIDRSFGAGIVLLQLRNFVFAAIRTVVFFVTMKLPPCFSLILKPTTANK